MGQSTEQSKEVFDDLAERLNNWLSGKTITGMYQAFNPTGSPSSLTGKVTLELPVKFKGDDLMKKVTNCDSHSSAITKLASAISSTIGMKLMEHNGSIDLLIPVFLHPLMFTIDQEQLSEHKESFPNIIKSMDKFCIPAPPVIPASDSSSAFIGAIQVIKSW